MAGPNGCADSSGQPIPERKAVMVNWMRRSGRETRRPRRLACESLEPRLLLSVTGDEQELVYLLNRARHDPAAYQIEQNLSVDLSQVAPRPPLAVNDNLFASAGFHAEEMATHDYFGHQSAVTGDWPNKMARDHGYQLPAAWSDDANYIESIGAGTWYYPARIPLNELIEDIGLDPPGHRIHLLGLDEFHAGNREIGVGYAFNAGSTFDHYWAIHATRRSTSDIFLTGVVFEDANGNGRYEAGEGLGGVTVSAGQQTTLTNAAGGWSVQVTPGEYEVTASGGAMAGTSTAYVVVENENIEIDFISGDPWGIVNFERNRPPVAADDLYLTTAGTPLDVPAASGVLANDTDADQDPLHAVLVGPADPGTVRLGSDGSFQYTPAGGFAGTDHFTYRAHDGKAPSFLASVTIGVAEPLGVTDFWQSGQLDLAAGDAWYSFQTARSGWLTLEASDDTTTLTLYDEAGDVVATAGGAGAAPRIDRLVGAAGQTFFLRASGTAHAAVLHLTNLVQQAGTTVTVYGTAGGDQFQYATTGCHRILINGTEYTFQDGEVETVHFQGGGGADTAYLRGSQADETFALYPDHGSMLRNGLAVNVYATTTIRVWGLGGNDQADFYGSPADDTYTGTAGYGRLVEPGSGVFLMASGVGQSVVHFGGQGHDVARLYGTAGDEQATAGPAAATLSGAGFSHQVDGFAEVKLFADEIGSPGHRGTDSVSLSDSAGDDIFTARLSEVHLGGDGWSIRAAGFDTAEFTSTAGADEGWFYGTPNDDRYEGRPDRITFTGTADGVAYTNIAHNLPWAVAFAKGGTDEAELFDSDGRDGFTGTFVYGRMAGTAGDGTSYFHRTVRFENVTAWSTQGDDVARFEDGPFNDEFHGQPDKAWLDNGKAVQTAHGFGTMVAVDVENPGPDGQDRDVGTSVAYLTGQNILEKPDGTRIVTGQTPAGKAYLMKVQAFDQYHYNQISSPATHWSLAGRPNPAAGYTRRLERTLAAVAEDIAARLPRFSRPVERSHIVDRLFEQATWLDRLPPW